MTKYKFKRKPRGWQVRALRKLMERDGGAIFAPMRSGKTKVVVDFIGVKAAKGEAKRVVIVAPLSALGEWRRSLAQDLPDDARVKIKLLNYERVYAREHDGDGGWYPVDNKKLLKKRVDMLVVDESHRAGDARTLANMKLWQLVKKWDPTVVLLTGTPLHRGPLKVFGQWKLLDHSVFGTSMTAYRRQYFVSSGYGGYKWTLTEKGTKKLRRKMAPDTFFMHHVPERDPVEVNVKFPLQESEAAYRALADTGFVSLGNRGTVDAENPLVRHLRLAQAVGGKIGTDDDGLQRVGREKTRAFEDLVRQFEDSEIPKFVVGCRFLFELAAAGKVAKKHGYTPLLYYGGVKEADREQRLLKFHETRKPTVFISQISTGSLGVDLSCAETMVLWSLTRSLVDFDQFKARIRLYREKRALTYYYLLGEGTVDEVNLLALHQGYDVVKFITEHPEFLSYRELG